MANIGGGAPNRWGLGDNYHKEARKSSGQRLHGCFFRGPVKAVVFLLVDLEHIQKRQPTQKKTHPHVHALPDHDQKEVLLGHTQLEAQGSSAGVLKKSVADEPLADEPLADEPLADEPLADEPLADEPSATRLYPSTCLLAMREAGCQRLPEMICVVFCGFHVSEL